ncbi:hypothetical protein BCR43DRAFT_486124 [Syncephalastrum racemosum]|uniref:F-box/LRR-repeat protein 15-like leucin rich repeat domain-containing protein n=1 Tax=Syncephalastrum racemosum TaxID=13706 RepID=A0A1X2HNI1_SYNRA|nr:hypothetical protein BCR43DRAFT_486124 [Syncephalastrum racemosum]
MGSARDSLRVIDISLENDTGKAVNVLEAALARCSCVTHIRLTSDHVPAAWSLRAPARSLQLPLGNVQSSLTHLTWSTLANFPDALLVACPNLRALSVAGTNMENARRLFERITVCCPALEQLHCNHPVEESICATSTRPGLRSLIIKGLDRVSDGDIATLTARHLQTLETLIIDDAAEESGSFWTHIAALGAENLRNLTYRPRRRDNDSVQEIYTAIRRSPRLVSVKMPFLDWGIEQVLQPLSELADLRELVLYGCTYQVSNGIQRVAEDLSTLKHTSSLENLEFCNYPCITDTALISMGKIRALRSIAVTDCNSLTTQGILEFIRRTEDIENINLSKCFAVTNEVLVELAKKKNLKTVNVSGCHNISDYGVRYLLANACSGLQSFNAEAPAISNTLIKQVQHALSRQ